MMNFFSVNFSEKGPNVEKGDQKGTIFSKKSPKETFPLKGDRLTDTAYALSKPKFEIRKISAFYRGVLYRTFAGMIGHDRKKRFFDFFIS